MADLLLELFSEEIPARMQTRAAADLKRLVTDKLKAAGLTFERADGYATPRRLALIVGGLPTAQPDVSEERRGPRTDAPGKAIQGFLGSVGLTLDQVEQRETPKGTFYYAVVHKKGRPTAEVLAEILPEALAALPWPKSMRWGVHELRWVRPLHAILCLFDGAVVPFGFGHIEAGDLTFGHRFLAPDRLRVGSADQYADRMKEAFVVIDGADRKAAIAEAAAKIAADEGLVLKDDPGLLEEVAGLVEWPVVLAGSIDEAFMDVPPEVLVTAMRTHQKYLALTRADGSLAPRFVLVSNMVSDDGGAAIIDGNERVLRARLADAKFFWDQDRKQTLESRVPALHEVIYHAKLGSLGDKVVRLQSLAAEIAPMVQGADRDICRSAALLAKADLTTEMVGEFPELQGLMGRYYAIGEGEKPAVADAVAEHYSPQGPGDVCPTAPTSVVVALADKIDALVGFFAIDEKPTGSKDPFALRRAALGVIRLILENKLRLPLVSLFELAERLYTESQDGFVSKLDTAELLAFFADRLKVHLREQGVRHDHIAAVFDLGGEDDLVRLLARVDALAGFLDSDDGANLLTAYRRAANILRIEEKKDGAAYDGDAAKGLLREAEERKLYDSLDSIGDQARQAAEREDYAAAMAALARLRAPVDGFFDRVTVNADEAELRENRLRLLSQIRGALHDVADFAKIEG